jgi:hypothetical protein
MAFEWSSANYPAIGFEGIGQLESVCSKTPVQTTEKTLSYSCVTPSMEIGLRRRRSKRLALRVPVIVYGRMKDKSAFHEKTRTLSVSAHGGMLALAAPVLVGQTILAVNEATGEEQEARVIYVEASVRGKAEVGIAFVGAAPNFWQVSFPAVRRKSSPN